MSNRPDPDRPTTHYPVLLDLRRRPVVVVGGGEVAEHKTAALIASGAAVSVVAPTLTPALAGWAAEARVRWVPREYRTGDLAGSFLAIAATDRTEVNQAVWEEADAAQIPLNAVDDPPRCSFILPALHRDGELTVAVSTGGKAPALAVRLRDRIARSLGDVHAAHLELLGSFRAEILARLDTFAARREVWYRIVDSHALDLVRRGQPEEARRLIGGIIDEAAGGTAEGAA